MTNTELLELEIERSGLKKTFIAKSIGVSRDKFYRQCKNKIPFDQYEIEKLCKILSITNKKRKMQIFFADDVDKLVNNGK